jgi:pimeloyl-ACP methyl ester carboxylesterase
MTTHRLDTPLGPVEIHGRDTGRPVQLVLTGAFADPNTLTNNQLRFPQLDVWRAHLPGNHAPELVTSSLGVFGAAYSHALRQLLQGRKAQVIGISAGALVALALNQDLVAGALLVEPPLWPTAAWPLLGFRNEMPPGGEDVVWSLFGVATDRTEPRDYRHLIEQLKAPAHVLIGGERLGAPRVVDRWPSLVDDETRQWLSAHPKVTVEEAPGAGHHILREANELFFAAVRRMTPA